MSTTTVTFEVYFSPTSGSPYPNRVLQLPVAVNTKISAILPQVQAAFNDTGNWTVDFKVSSVDPFTSERNQLAVDTNHCVDMTDKYIVMVQQIVPDPLATSSVSHGNTTLTTNSQDMANLEETVAPLDTIVATLEMAQQSAQTLCDALALESNTRHSNGSNIDLLGKFYDGNAAFIDKEYTELLAKLPNVANKMTVYEFCKTEVGKATLVLLTMDNHFCQFPKLMTAARCEAQHIVRDVVLKIDKRYASKDTDAVATFFHRWIGHEHFQNIQGSRGSLHITLRQALYRLRKRGDGHVSKRRRNVVAVIEATTIDSAAEQCRSQPNLELVQRAFNATAELRARWITQLKDQRGVVLRVITKFPVIRENVNYLQEDYKFNMANRRLSAVNVATWFQNLLPGILELSGGNPLADTVSQDAKELLALDRLLSLVRNHYNKPESCPTEKLILRNEEGAALHLMIAEKKRKSTFPMILCVTDYPTSQYYIGVDDEAHEVKNGTLAEALHHLMAIVYIFDLQYDPELLLFFRFLEQASGMHQRMTALPRRLLDEIKGKLRSLSSALDSSGDNN